MSAAPISTNGKRLFIARHGETVFNAAARMQGMSAHTPLTNAGCLQASAMGRALRSHITGGSLLKLIASPSGRTLQTLALVSEEIGRDWHLHETDERLSEISVGSWEGRYYHDVHREIGDFVDDEAKLFTQFAPDGENYTDVARRLRAWIGDQDFAADMLVITHGMTARLLRAILTGLPDHADHAAPIAPGLAQGSMVMIRDGEESLVLDGEGSGERV